VELVGVETDSATSSVGIKSVQDKNGFDGTMTNSLCENVFRIGSPILNVAKNPEVAPVTEQNGFIKMSWSR
jgi:hypothetical protein